MSWNRCSFLSNLFLVFISWFCWQNLERFCSHNATQHNTIQCMFFFHSPIYTQFDFHFADFAYIPSQCHFIVLQYEILLCLAPERSYLYVYIRYFVYNIDRITDSKIDIEIKTTENEALKGRSNTVNSNNRVANNKTDKIDKLWFQEEEEKNRRNALLVGWFIFSLFNVMSFYR